jgi:hypothetical protein
MSWLSPNGVLYVDTEALLVVYWIYKQNRPPTGVLKYKKLEITNNLRITNK